MFTVALDMSNAIALVSTFTSSCTSDRGSEPATPKAAVASHPTSPHILNLRSCETIQSIKRTAGSRVPQKFPPALVFFEGPSESLVDGALCLPGRGSSSYMRKVQPGQRIGKYVLGERIAIGGMAEVWAARVEGPQGFVKSLALKFMLESFAGDTELERLFVNEARVAAQLQHANIVSIFDFDKVTPEQGGGAGGRYYIAMERVEGRDLRQIALGALGAGQAFPRPLALYVAGEVLKGLRYVHERRGEGRRPLGLIHRDVSPHNVLVAYTGEVKLSDFGIAKARTHSSSDGATGNIRGKLAYASPEQLENLALDHRTDQFALGITLWELLAGRRLFEGADEMEVMTRVSRCQIPPFSSLPATRDIAPEVETVVRRMLYRRPEGRLPTP